MSVVSRSIVGILALALMAGVACNGDDGVGPPGAVDHTFVYSPHGTTPDIQSINLAGSFAAEGEPDFWNPERNAFTQQTDGSWAITMTLEPGTYEYKYVINGQWPSNMCASDTWGNPPGGAIDPHVQECVDDGHGGMNAQLVIE
jgi:cyclomaltodextrinase / maltogenic alpha-amylase / neopullulanase